MRILLVLHSLYVWQQGNYFAPIPDVFIRSSSSSKMFINEIISSFSFSIINWFPKIITIEWMCATNPLDNNNYFLWCYQWNWVIKRAPQVRASGWIYFISLAYFCLNFWSKLKISHHLLPVYFLNMVKKILPSSFHDCWSFIRSWHYKRAGELIKRPSSFNILRSERREFNTFDMRELN